MVNLIYHADEVGPVCQRVATRAPGSIRVFSDKRVLSPKGTTVRWGSLWPGTGNREINSASAVALAKDKHASRATLEGLAPKTWFKPEDVQFPCVVRPRTHHAAHKFFVCKGMLSLTAAVKSCKAGWYASELVDKAREFRVFILQDHIVAVSERFPANPTDIAWNLAVGGRLINVKREDWPTPVLLVALEAAQLLLLDWAAIDLAIDKNGSVVVFEANTAPGLRNPHTISRIAKGLKWVDTHTTPTREQGTKWKNLVHPALR